MNTTIKGITHPIPTEFAKRIYDGKTVFICKRYLGKAQKGDKFIVYESHGAKAYTGWADIISITQMKPKQIREKYEKQMMLNKEEFKEYSYGQKLMTAIEFNNFELFKNKVTPKRFVCVGGKYINKDEFNRILKTKK